MAKNNLRESCRPGAIRGSIEKGRFGPINE
jgi:hypothetical protein